MIMSQIKHLIESAKHYLDNELLNDESPGSDYAKITFAKFIRDLEDSKSLAEMKQAVAELSYHVADQFNFEQSYCDRISDYLAKIANVLDNGNRS